MPTLTLPPKTAEVLGGEAAAEFARWAAETFTVRDEVVHRDEFREVLSRLDIIEHDLVGVKERLDAVDARFDHLQSRMNDRFDAVHARFDAMGERSDDRFDRLQSEMNARFDRMYREMGVRFDTMGERFDARFDRMYNEMDTRFDHMNSGMNARFDGVHERIDTIHDVVRSQTRWLVGTLIAIGGLISVLITVFEFIK